VTIGNDLIYVQARGSIVRRLTYDEVRQAYAGDDMTVFATHIVDGYELKDMGYAEVPFSIDWIPRDDGVMAGFTYLRDHEILGWHRHATYTSDKTVQSVITSVAVIPEDGVDILYMIVQRVINLVTVRYVEKMVRRCTSWLDESEVP
jgi:hypothetical protein